MELMERLAAGATVSEVLEMAPEVRELVARVAATALEAGRMVEAEKILEGLVATHPRDPASWALLARAHQRTGKGLAGRFAVEVGRHLAPDDPQVRLAHAELLLGSADGRRAAVAELRGLQAIAGEIGERADALLTALGEPAIT
jgi:cytochrome c-type biogenesis protein CcmH/NrfG